MFPNRKASRNRKKGFTVVRRQAGKERRVVTASGLRFFFRGEETLLSKRILTVAISFEHTKNHCPWGGILRPEFRSSGLVVTPLTY